MRAARRPSRTAPAVLAALTVGPLSGYEVRKVVLETIGHFWHEGFGQIYPALARLAEEGLIETRAEPGAAGPARNVHRLTPAGWTALRAWVAEPVTSEEPRRSELLLKLFLGQHVPLATSAGHVRERRATLAALLARYEAAEAEIRREDSPGRPFWLATVRHGVLLARAGLQWCDETLAMLTGTTATTATQEAP